MQNKPLVKDNDPTDNPTPPKPVCAKCFLRSCRCEYYKSKEIRGLGRYMEELADWNLL